MYISLVINHAPNKSVMAETTTDTVTPTSCVVTQIQQQSTVTIVTTTILVSATTRDIVQPASTVTSYVTLSTATPQSSCSCSGQQQTSASSSSSDSDAVTICVPIVVVFGVIFLIVVVIIGILIWRRTKSSHNALPYNKVDPTTTTVENDLYGLVMLYALFAQYKTTS